MTSSLRIVVGILGALICSSCSSKDTLNKNQEKTGITIPESTCSSAFVLSNKDSVRLYAGADSEYELVATVPLKNTVGAFLDCERRLLVAPYAYRDSGDSRFGIVFYDVGANVMEDLPLQDGMNSVVDHFKDGILVATGRVQQRKTDGTKTLKPAMTSEEVNPLDNIFAYTHYIDLDKRAIADSFEFLMVEGSVFKDKFYGAGIDGLVVYDLQKRDVETQIKLQAAGDVGVSSDGIFRMPKGGQYFSSNAQFYYLPDASSYNFSNRERKGKLVNLDRKTLYQLNGGELKPYMEIPAFEAPSMVRSKNEVGILEHDLSQFAVVNLAEKSIKLVDMSDAVASDVRVKTSVIADDNLIVVASKKGDADDSFIVVYDMNSGKVTDRLSVQGSNYIVTSTSDLAIF